MIAEEILSVYEQTKSIRATAQKADCSPQSVRRVLITNGIYPTEKSREIVRLLTLDYSIEDIARVLEITPKTVRNYLPHTKGSYAIGTKSENAKRIAKYRERKNNPAQQQP